MKKIILAFLLFFVSLIVFSDIKEEEAYYYTCPVVGHYLFIECGPDPNWADFSDNVIKGMRVFEESGDYFIQFFFMDVEKETYTLYLAPFKLVKADLDEDVCWFAWEGTSVVVFFVKDNKTDDTYILGKDMSEEPNRQIIILKLYPNFEEEIFEE